MEIIHAHLYVWDDTLARVPLPVDRLTLAKRRWRRTAPDGREFGFDLEHPLSDGDVFFQTAETRYHIEQQPEPVLTIEPGSAEDAARIGWKIGNTHFQIAVTNGAIHVPDDDAVRQLLQREGIAHRQILAVFRPLHGIHSHGLDSY